MRLTLKRTLGILALVPLLMMATTSVQATVISFTAAAPTASVSDAGPLSTSTPSGTLLKFDAGLGVLNSATFTLTGGLNTGVSCTYFGFGGPAGCSTDLSVSFVAPGSLVPLSHFVRSAECTAEAFLFGSSIDSSCTATNSLAAVVNLSTVTTGAGNLGLLTGTGTETYTVDVKLSYPNPAIVSTGSGLALLSSNAGAGGEVLSLKVDYDYTPVPEPTTVLLLSLGLLGIVVGKSRGQRPQYS